MSYSHSFQRKKQIAPASLLPTTVLPIHPFAPVPSHATIPSSTDLQASLELASHLGWSFGRIAITREDLPPEQQYVMNPVREQVTASSAEHVLQPKAVEPPVGKENTTGLPDQLKAGIEYLSGLSLDDVHVHYNSPQPTEVQALAYTQGTEIHVGLGQERHLAHEAWHVVQQKQGRVRPVMQVEGMAINDDEGLEKEADVMGARAASGQFAHTASSRADTVEHEANEVKGQTLAVQTSNQMHHTQKVVQRLEDEEKEEFLQVVKAAIKRSLDAAKSSDKKDVAFQVAEKVADEKDIDEKDVAFQVAEKVAEDAGSIDEAWRRIGDSMKSKGLPWKGTESAVKIGYRDVEKATDAKKKFFNVWGPVTFKTEEMRLPEYRETNAMWVYYSATKLKNLQSILESGFKTSYGGNGDGSVEAPKNVGQFNSRGHIYFFNSESNAKEYGKTNVDGDIAIIKFTLPKANSFTPDPEAGFNLDAEVLSATQALRTNQDIPPVNIQASKAWIRNLATATEEKKKIHNQWFNDVPMTIWHDSDEQINDGPVTIWY